MSIDEIRARLNAATAGPWYSKHCAPCTERGRLDLQVWDQSGNLLVTSWCDMDELHEPDAEFIAHAPTDVARLLAAVEGVEKRLAQWEERFTGTASDEVAMRAAIYLIRQDITSALDPS